MNLRTIILQELVNAGLSGQKLVDSMGRIEEYLETQYRKRGEKGGKARSAKLSPQRRSEIARMGANAKWGKS